MSPSEDSLQGHGNHLSTPWSGFLVLSALWIIENREFTGQFKNQSEKIKKNFQKETFGFLTRQLCPSKVCLKCAHPTQFFHKNPNIFQLI
jgi:hypothetical protein